MVLPARNEALRHGSTPPLLVISASTGKFLWRRVGAYTCELVCMQIADISAVMGVSVQMETMSPFEGANVSAKSVIGHRSYRCCKVVNSAEACSAANWVQSMLRTSVGSSFKRAPVVSDELSSGRRDRQSAFW